MSFGKRERFCGGVCETGVVRYVTRIERFQLGQYPMVCVRSGLPATKLVPVQARRTTVWPWMLLPFSVIWFAIVKWVADSDHPWGRLPFAEGHVEGVSATYDTSIGVILEGVHPEFVEATRRSQRGHGPDITDVRRCAAPGDSMLERDHTR